MKSSEAPIPALAKAVVDLHGGVATWLESVPVKETFAGETVWEGVVQVFALSGHPTATRCYVWSYVTDENTGKRRFFAVLHQGPVDSLKLRYARRLRLNIERQNPQANPSSVSTLLKAARFQ